MADFIPRQELALVAWVKHFDQTLRNAPNEYGITAQQSATLQPLVQTFVATSNVAASPGTRTRTAIAEREAAKASMLVEIRRLVAIVRRAPGVDESKQFDLGLNPIRDKSRIGAPRTAVSISAEALDRRTIRIVLKDSDTDRRSKPAGVSGAAIFVHLGDQPPNDIREWAFHSNQTRTIFPLKIHGPLEYGQKVWLCAHWLSTRNLPGTASTPVSVRIVGGPELPGDVQTLAAA